MALLVVKLKTISTTAISLTSWLMLHWLSGPIALVLACCL